jgi:hypothetical protein
MKRLFVLLGIVVLLGLIAIGIQQIEHFQKQREARDGLDASIAQLPTLAGFTTIKVVPLEFSHTAYGKTCYYARGYVIAGSSFSETEALDTYTEKIRSLGWMPEGMQAETSRVLMHAANERMEIYSGKPGVDIDGAMDYDQLRQTYRSLIFVSLDYMIPSRDEC